MILAFTITKTSTLGICFTACITPFPIGFHLIDLSSVALRSGKPYSIWMTKHAGKRGSPAPSSSLPRFSAIPAGYPKQKLPRIPSFCMYRANLPQKPRLAIAEIRRCLRSDPKRNTSRKSGKFCHQARKTWRIPAVL